MSNIHQSVKNLEQVSRLDASLTAHKHIVDMIDEGVDIVEVRRHCLRMIDAAQMQALILKNNSNTN